MIISNNIQNPKMFLGNSDVLRIYQGLNIVYEAASPVIEPCFEVVNLISSASGDYIDVYELSTSKWYKKNNINAYEEYGVMETVQSLQDATYYTGKLVILSTDNHEYKWNGSSWSDLGNAGDIKTYTFLDGGASSDYKIPFDFYWGNGYKMEILCKRSSIVTGDLRVIDTNSTSPIEFSFLNNGGFYLDRHNPKSTTSNACNTTDYDDRIIAQSGVLNNYLNDFLKVEIELMKLKFTCGDRTATSGGTTYTASWYDGLYRASIVSQKSNNISICNVKIYDDQGNVLNDIEPKVNPNGQYLVTLYDKILDAEYNPTQATSTPAYHYESSGTVTPVEEYQEKVAPANNVHYNTLAELELLECPWVGMLATIGNDNTPYKYTEDGWIENEPVKVLPEGYTQYNYIEQTSTSRHQECRIDLKFNPSGLDDNYFVWDVPYNQGDRYVSAYGCDKCEFQIKLDSGFYFGMNIGFGDTQLVKNVTNNSAIVYPCYNKKAWFNTSRYGIKYKEAENNEWTVMPESTFQRNGVTLPLAANWETSGEVAIFHSSDNMGSAYPATAMKLYRFTNKNVETGEVMHDFVPATNPSGNKGLYDLITETWCPCSNDSYFTMGQAV